MGNRTRKYLPVITVLVLWGQVVFSTASQGNRMDFRLHGTPAMDFLVTDSAEEVSTPDNDERTAALSLSDTIVQDSISGTDSLPGDTAVLPPLKKNNFLEDIITGKNKDSLIYDVKNKLVYIYREGDITYQDMNLKADYITVDMNSKNIHAYGYMDSLDADGNLLPPDSIKPTRPEFTQGGSSYTMDSINYNLDTKKAKIKGVATQEGEGYLIGRDIKKMPDNAINIANGKYTTCDNVNHPHFYLALTRAKLTSGENGQKKKVVTGPAYFVMEDVPIYFLGIPFGFFPVSKGRQSGFIMPQYGEEYVKGFFIRDGGYYFAFNDYLDVTLKGGIYTLGSWETSLATRYIKRYKYSGGFNLAFSKDIIGEKGDADYVNMNNFRITWSHQQDPKFRPNSTFSANVNFSTSGYTKYGTNNINDYLNTQTNSSVAYSKTWAGKPFSLSTNFQHSQNSQDTTVSLSFPNIVFSVSRFFPFRRKEAIGRQKWYEKISMQYTGTLSNNVTVKEKDLFTDKMFREMKNGVNHTIPISTSFNLLNYITVSPSANYTERWYFRKIDKQWNPETNMVENADTTYGFYRLYNYNFSMSASTKLYGTFTFGENKLIKAIRHVMTPTVSFTYTPDFSKGKYGFYKPIQTDSMGTLGYYSPFEGGLFGLPGRGEAASISFGLTNTLEMKVRSDRDTTGSRIIKLIDNFSLSSSYNFLADSLNLQPFALNLRTTIYGNFGLNISATLDPYQVDERGQRINKFMIKKGKLGRITSASTSFGYSFNPSSSGRPAVNDINSGMGSVSPAYTDPFAEQQYLAMDPNTRRALMTSQYYDFDLSWNLSFNYSLSYTNTGIRKNVTQTLGFNGSMNLTPKWGISFNGGYDFQARKITPGVITINRDLHCWQMNFSWVPVGFRKSWSFNIGVKSAMLQDIKWDKRSSFYDNLYD